MRLSVSQRAAIKREVAARDRDAKVYLFGSRVDDNAKGGDIDLLVLSKRMDRRQARTLKLRLYDHRGEQKIDLVCATDLSRPFTRMAVKRGELL